MASRNHQDPEEVKKNRASADNKEKTSKRIPKEEVQKEEDLSAEARIPIQSESPAVKERSVNDSSFPSPLGKEEEEPKKP